MNARDNKGFVPLHEAVNGGISDYDKKRNKEIVDLLISKGADLNVESKEGDTPLHKAMFWGTPEIVEALVDNNANLGVSNSEGQTPLHLAAYWGREKFIDIILKKTVDVNAKDQDLNTPLHLFLQKLPEFYCSKDKIRKIAQALLEKGASVRTENKEGKCALDMTEDKEMLELLKKFS